MSLLMNPKSDLKRVSTSRLNVIAVCIFLVFFLSGLVLTVYLNLNNPSAVFLGAFLGWIAALSPKIAKQWERGIVLRLGKYRAREKRARVILGEAEREIAHLFEEASRMYQDNPTALHLRAMNMLYEGLKEKGALMLVPSTAVESMGMGGMLGAAALRQSQLSEKGSGGSPSDSPGRGA